MLSGLRVEKKEKEKPAKEKKSKKEKKKERRKEQKRRKKDKKQQPGAKKKAAGSKSSASSADGSDSSAEGSGAPGEAKVPPPAAAAAAVPPPSDDGAADAAAGEGRDKWMTKGPALGDDDFFSRLGSEKKREERKMKPDPDKHQVSEREYNPFLRGEVSSQPAPEESGQIPAHLKVGDGGSSWRKRALKRQQQQATDAGGADGVGAGAAGAGSAGSGGRGREAAPDRGQPPPGSSASSRGGASAPPRQRGSGRSRSRSGSRRSPGRSRRRPSPEDDRRRRGGGRASPSPQRRRGGRSRSKSPRPPRSEAPAKSSPSSAAAAASPDDDSDDVMARMQRKYGGGAQSSAASSSSAPAPKKVETEDPNALGAMAMEAMLAGDMAKYEELNKKLERAQAKLAANVKDENAEAAAKLLAASEGSSFDDDGSWVRVLEEVDASGRNKALLESVQSTSVRTKGRNKRGTANAVPGKGAELSGYYEDDNVSLEELMKRERVQGVQDYDSNLAHHIMKKGSKYKALHEDEDEAYALGWYEHSDKKMDDKRRGEKKQKQEIRDKQRVQVNLERCTFCMESKRFGRKDAVVSNGQHAYLCFEGMNQCILPGQVFIAPMEHLPATTELDEQVWTEIRNYQKCLVRYFESENPPRAVIFGESAVHRVSRDKALLGAGPHVCVVAYPIDHELLAECRAYWKKALDEAENEFTTTHKKVIETDTRGGVRAKVPKGFPYIHIDFALGGGFAHVVDDMEEFPKDFIQHTVAGMCELTILDRAYAGREEYRQAVDTFKKKFKEGGFDWTAALKDE